MPVRYDRAECAEELAQRDRILSMAMGDWGADGAYGYTSSFEGELAGASDGSTSGTHISTSLYRSREGVADLGGSESPPPTNARPCAVSVKPRNPEAPRAPTISHVGAGLGSPPWRMWGR